jgi:hypothetical protein
MGIRKGHGVVSKLTRAFWRETHAYNPHRGNGQSHVDREAAAAKGRKVADALHAFQESHGWEPYKNADKSLALNVRRNKNPFGSLVQVKGESVNIEGRDLSVSGLKSVMGTYKDNKRNLHVVYTTQDRRTFDLTLDPRKVNESHEDFLRRDFELSRGYVSPGEFASFAATRNERSFVGATTYGSLIFGSGTGGHGSAISSSWDRTLRDKGDVISIHSNVSDEGGNVVTLQEDANGKRTLSLIHSWESGLDNRPQITVRHQSIVVHPDIEDVALLADSQEEISYGQKFIALTWRDGTASTVSMSDIRLAEEQQKTLIGRDNEKRDRESREAAAQAGREARAMIDSYKNRNTSGRSL